jgi:glycosyltransferase involved in cell wall biosynthesis
VEFWQATPYFDKLMAADTAKHLYMVYQTDLDPKGQGGGVRYVQELLEYLLDRGWRVDFLGAGEFAGKPHPHLRFHGVSSLYCPWTTFFFGLGAFLWRQRSLPDSVVHVHRCYFALPFIFLKPASKLVCTLHGDTLLVLGGRRPALRRLVEPFFRLVELFCLGRLNRIIAVDERTAAKFLGRYPFPWLRGKLQVIPSAVNLGKFSPGDRLAARNRWGYDPAEDLVLFVGRLEKIKNLPFLLRVFARLQSDNPRARLLLAGNGPDKDTLQEYSKSLGLTRVEFLGAVPHDEMPWLMQAADVLALCSTSEASPIVVKEAVAVGLPVVSVDVGDVRQVIKHQEQGTVTTNDEQHFMEALVARLGNHKISSSKSPATLDTDFSAEVSQAKIAKIYQELSNSVKEM